MSLDDLRAEARKCVSLQDVAGFLQANKVEVLRHAAQALGHQITWQEAGDAYLMFSARVRTFKFDSEIPGWVVSFEISLHPPTGISPLDVADIVKTMLELFAIRVTSCSGLLRVLVTCELNADDWTQMLMYRRLMDLDSY